MLTRTMLFPMIRRFWVLFLSMIAVSCLGIALMTGLGGAYHSFHDGCDAYVEDYAYAHGTVTTAVTAAEPELDRVEGVSAVIRRMHGDFALKKPDRTVTVRLFTFRDGDFQKFYILHEADPGDMPEIWLETRFAANNGLTAGSTVELKTADGYREFFISKLVTSPECIRMEQNAWSWGDNSDFGYGFLPQIHAGTVFGREDLCNQFLLLFDGSRQPKDILADCEAALGDVQVLNSFVYADSVVRQAIEVNTEPLKALSLLLPMLFFLLMLLMIVLFLSQIIRQCRREIGILRALGFGRLQTASLFCGIVFAVTLAAGVLGLLLGKAVAEITAGLYADIAAMPPFPVSLPADTAVQAVILTVLTGQAAAAVSTSAILRIQPSEAMRPKAPAAAKVPEGLKKLLSLLRPMGKFTSFSVLRNFGRFLAATLCIAAAMTLILSGLAFDSSKDRIVTQLFDERLAYDCQISLQKFPDEAVRERIAAVKGVTAVEPMALLPAEITFGDLSETAVLNGIDPATDMVRVPDRDGNRIPIPEEGIVLDRHLAERLGVKAGDTVTVEGTDLTVTALSDQHACRAQYLSLQQTLALSEDCFGALLVHADDETALMDGAAELEGYGGATFTRLLRHTTEESFRQFSVGVAVVLLFSFLLGLLIVFHMTRASMAEQQRELAVLRILGFQRRQISLSQLGKALLQYVLALAAGLPAGTAIAKYVLSQMSTKQREYPFSNDPGQYVLTVLLVLGFVLASHFLAMAQMRRWNLAEASKSQE